MFDASNSARKILWKTRRMLGYKFHEQGLKKYATDSRLLNDILFDWNKLSSVVLSSVVLYIAHLHYIIS